MQLLLKILSGMANYVDPDQTLFGYAILPETLVYEILGHLLLTFSVLFCFVCFSHLPLHLLMFSLR